VSLGSRIGRFFNRRHLSLGWSLLWRLFLLMLPVRLLGELAAWGQASGGGPAAGGGAVGALFALPVGGNVYLFPLALPVMLFGLNGIGKHVARRRLEREVAGFVGWSIYWRWALLQLAGVVGLAAVLAPVIFAAVKVGGEGRSAAIFVGALALILLPALVLWGLNAAGWSLVRAVERAPAAAPAEVAPVAGAPAGPVHDWTRLFDHERYGFNWWLAGAWALTMVLMPWASTALRSLIAGELMDPPGLDWYPVYVLVSLGEGAAFAYLSHRLTNGWLLPPAMAVVAVLLTLVEAGASGHFEPWFLVSSALHALLVVGGLVAGVRLLGARIAGFLAGLGAGLLAWGLVYPAVLIAGLPPEVGPMPAEFYREIYLLQAILRPLEAVALAGLLFAAVQRHLRRRGLRLAGGAVRPAPGGRA
jgi:hypothetical protein